MLRSGRIVYTNDLPIYTAFDEGAVRFPGALVADVPANLNAMLLDGRLDMGPMSAAAYAGASDRFMLLPELCIGSRADVWSVVCVSKLPLRGLDGARIAVTRESASGRGLLRVLLERRYGISAEFEESTDPYAAAAAGRPALLIGDRAIDARQTFNAAHVHDLGAEWHAWTGLDMVYAVWVVRRDVLDSNGADVRAAWQALVAAHRWGERNPQRVIGHAQRAHPRPGGFYGAYYETLNFTFDGRARAGLTRYFEELHALGAIASVPSCEEAFVVAR
ncbi:MAG: menaquinone biosynthesis protein [Candidatus Eremiobacteraeota bacterium]|nr:menaquinone biosynthesis protein [Candidatus Eremiobacteraeota bacterium]